MGLLAAEAREQGPNMWIACEDAEELCVVRIVRENRFLAVKNPAPAPTLCGSILLKLQAPVPWAWSKAPPRMPSKLLPLNVKC